MKSAFHEYYKLKKVSFKLRESWLDTLATKKAIMEGGNKESIYKSLLLQEQQRHSSQRLKHILDKLQKGLTSVVILENGTEKEIFEHG